jgi:hypothetical protein
MYNNNELKTNQMHNSLKIIKTLLYFLFRSTCFGHSCAHHQERQ